MRTRLTIAGIGNLIDTISTIYLYNLGFTEANPIMAQLLNYPILFALVKLSTMTVILVWLWRERESKYARIAAVVSAVLYGLIALYYAWFFAFLL